MTDILGRVNEIDMPTEYEKLTVEERDVLQGWIRDNLKPIQSMNRNCTSYSLKHFFEDSDDGFYTTNGMFKGAMLEAGFYTKDDNTVLNWSFNVSQKSVRKLYKLLGIVQVRAPL